MVIRVTITPLSKDLADSALAVIEMASRCAGRGWIPATSGNFSVRISPTQMLVTASGGDKAALAADNLIVMEITTPDHPRASAEAPLHAAIYRARPEAHAIAHVHAQSAVLASMLFADQGGVVLHGLELQKALDGVSTHETTIRIPIFANDQDMIGLARRVEAEFATGQAAWGLLLRGHGLYVWGATQAAALRHVEAMDAMFTTLLSLRGNPV